MLSIMPIPAYNYIDIVEKIGWIYTHTYTHTPQHSEAFNLYCALPTYNNNNFIKMATIAVELYNWHSKTINDNKLIKTKI